MKDVTCPLLSQTRSTLQVYVGDELCGTVDAVQTVYKFSCQMSGNVVKVVTRGQYQTLCEVQVIGELEI